MVGTSRTPAKPKRYAITLMNALRYLPLSALLIVLPVMAGKDLPESEEAVCQTYESGALKKCHSLYEEASKGRLKALVNIGIAIHNEPLPDTEDWFQYNLDGISRHERAIQWFRLARELGSKDANYWIAKTINSSFEIAALIPSIEAVAPPSKEINYGQLIKAALKVGLPAEAFSAAQKCSTSPGCMKMLGEFYERGFGTSVSVTLAAEWYAKSAIKFAAIGNRDEAIKSLEILTSRYSAYPYTSEVKKQLFPQPKSKQEKQPKAVRKSA